MPKLKKTRHGDYRTLVRFPVFSDFAVYIVFTDDVMKSRDSRYNATETIEGADALFVHQTGTGQGHLFFTPDVGAGVIAHEVWHAIREMFLWVRIVEWDNELCAYHLGYLVGKVSAFQAKVLAVKSKGRGQSCKKRKSV